MNTEFKKTPADEAIQSEVRQILGQRHLFHVEKTLPDALREKLERLDRVVAEKSRV